MAKQDLYLPEGVYPKNAGSGAFALRYSSQSQPSIPETVRRLIVLFPAGADYTTETHRIWKLADVTHTRVLLLGLCKTAAQEPSLRRQLVTMAALIGNDRVITETKVDIGTSWMNCVMASCQADDMIVCFAEHRTGLLHRPLHEILKGNVDVCVYVLSELHPQKSNPNWFSQVILWSGFIAIIVGFSILQIRIAGLLEDWFQTVLFIFSIIPEFWLIWVWNNLYD